MIPFPLEEELRALSDLSEPAQPCSPVCEAISAYCDMVIGVSCAGTP